MSINNITRSDQPHDRLTALCAVMTDALDEALDKEEAEQNASEVKGIIFLNDKEKGGIQVFGYNDTGEALADLFVHLKAMFSAMGKGFGIMDDKGEILMPVGPIPEEPA